MPRASTKVFKKRRGVLIKEDVIKIMMVVVKAILLFQRTLLMKRIVLMVQSFVLMKLNHLPATRETCEHSMAEAVSEAVDENDGKGTLLLLLMVAGRSVVFLRRMAW
ncbi:hypothetical protein TNCV_1636831 [Trichonephila clavipes]|nr:hypothetical protein TNCV_1636831 [Trichonephila clavipes]